MKNKITLYIILLFIIVVIFIIFVKRDNDLKVGFVGGLSGKYSDLGHSVLNGLKLAFEQNNYKAGSLNLKLLIKDDMQNEFKAMEAIKYFEEEEIPLIIGNTTSSMTKISIDETKNSNIILFSPSASSANFSGIDDNFFRVQVALSKEGFTSLSKYLIKNNLENIFAIYDERNSSFSNSYITNFQESLLENGGKVYKGTYPFSEDFKNILNKLEPKLKDIKTILIVANSLDSSKLIQFLRINKIDKRVVVASWAKSSEFLIEGGKNIEGTIFLSSYDENSKSKEYMDFVEDYTKKYNTKPTIFSAQGYETGRIIIDVLKKNQNIKEFKKTLLSIKKFQGLQGYITFDNFGDINRDEYLTQVTNGKFVKIEY